MSKLFNSEFVTSHKFTSVENADLSSTLLSSYVKIGVRTGLGMGG